MYKKKITVIGLGISGTSVIDFLCKKGAIIFVSDSSERSKSKLEALKQSGKINAFEVGHTEKILAADLIVISPGVPRDLAILEQADVPIISELELGFRYLNTKNVIAVTGTNGKTTTVYLIEHILKYFKKDVFLCGNVGTPITAIAERTTKDSIVIIEVSSYQLEWVDQFEPSAAAILNITPDHLSRYKSIEEYAEVKFRIFNHRPKISILNMDDFFSRPAYLSFSLNNKEADIYLDNNRVIFHAKNFKFDISFLKVIGNHNIANIMAAILLVQDFCFSLNGIQELKNAINSFEGLEHRLKLVCEKGGARYVNDSKSTNIDSTRVALESFEGNIILMLGGEHKGASLSPLVPLIKRKVTKLIIFGESRELIKDELKEFSAMTEIFPRLADVKLKAESGGTVLFSPACASFDEFKNYKERGDFFVDKICCKDHLDGIL
ncbi:MAG: UDP-N-acetylmuramoyl-L-alanine--D-glutamate ligase [bacterium]|nr:UDP-N-acetylmuramoyl-L-alanine--D-glutamate ligase [bacterium]